MTPTLLPPRYPEDGPLLRVGNTTYELDSETAEDWIRILAAFIAEPCTPEEAVRLGA